MIHNEAKLYLTNLHGDILKVLYTKVTTQSQDSVIASCHFNANTYVGLTHI